MNRITSVQRALDVLRPVGEPDPTRVRDLENQLMETFKQRASGRPASRRPWLIGVIVLGLAGAAAGGIAAYEWMSIEVHVQVPGPGELISVETEFSNGDNPGGSTSESSSGGSTSVQSEVQAAAAPSGGSPAQPPQR